MSCSVILCDAGNPHTRCSQGCVNSTTTTAGHHHRRRAAVTETSSHYISQGPLRLRRSSVATDSSVSLNLNVVFIVGTLLVIAGLVCGVIIHRSKRPQIKYQKLPSLDF
ncbi:hypothetical protein GN956_G26072 [Arapaima gigas]